MAIQKLAEMQTEILNLSRDPKTLILPGGNVVKKAYHTGEVNMESGVEHGFAVEMKDGSIDVYGISYRDCIIDGDGNTVAVFSGINSRHYNYTKNETNQGCFEMHRALSTLIQAHKLLEEEA